MKKKPEFFYYRMPGEAKGHITGIVGKEFVTITGDGQSTIEQLLMLDPRYILQLPFLKKSSATELTIVLPKGDVHVLVPFGNHSRGAKFLDISYLIDQELIDSMDKVCKQIEGFYFGRIDIRYENWDALRQGKQFAIVELNGAGSEPTHMYDPRHSVFFAWREIIRHWNIMAKIARINRLQQKIPYMRIKDGLRIIRENKEYIKIIAPEQ